MNEITKEKFESYREVQKSGRVNMFDVGNVVKLSGLTRTECFDIMKNYGKYLKQFEGDE